MKVTLTVSLVMVKVCVVTVVVAVPAIVVAPVPAVVPYTIASMLPTMLPLVPACMTKITAITIVAPIIASITIVTPDGHPTEFRCKTYVFMFNVDR